VTVIRIFCAAIVAMASCAIESRHAEAVAVRGPAPYVAPALLSWSQANPTKALRFLHGAAVPVTFREALRINSEDMARDLIAVGEAEGVRQIRRLGRSTTVEEAWAYVPQAGFWIEIGIYGRDDLQLGPLIEIDVLLLSRLVETFDRVHLYHLHPEPTFSASFGIDGVYPPGTPVSALDKAGVVTVGLAVPSPADIETAIHIALLQEDVHSGSEVRNFVVNPYGVVEYQLTSGARRDIALNQSNPMHSLERTLITMSAIRRAAFNIEQTAAQHPGLTISGLIDELCGQLAGDNLVVRQVERW
jgi:hypothetical protein